MKTTSATSHRALGGWVYYLFGIQRNYTIAAILITLIGLSSVLNNYVTLRYAGEWRRAVPAQRPASVSQSSSPPAAEDDVYRHLDQLLSTEDPRAQCRRLLEMGGRCFVCQVARNGFVNNWTDGRKSVCLDLLRPNCSVLSFGINNDFSFEEDMEDLGCTVHAFDPTMGMGSFRKSPGIHFHSVGIGAEDNELGGFPVASLGTLVRQIGLKPGVIDYMKMDVESSEWGMLEQQLATSGDLLRVKQLAIEFHLLQWSPVLAEGVGIKEGGELQIYRENAVRFVAVLKAMKNAGFVLMNGKQNAQCKNYNNGCVAYIHETVWFNTKISEQSATWLPF